MVLYEQAALPTAKLPLNVYTSLILPNHLGLYSLGDELALHAFGQVQYFRLSAQDNTAVSLLFCLKKTHP